MIGEVFGRLTVVSLYAISPKRWTCQCACGATTNPRQESLRSGHTLSCGCLRRDAAFTHRLTGHELYKTWANMKARCGCPTDGDYHRYGARGIRVCDRWSDSFPDFLEDMGPRPSISHSIDRIDNSKGYSPENCRWATTKEQARNRRSTRLLSHDGQAMSVAGWEEKMGLRYGTISNRINKHGWTPARAITTPMKVRETA